MGHLWLMIEEKKIILGKNKTFYQNDRVELQLLGYNSHPISSSFMKLPHLLPFIPSVIIKFHPIKYKHKKHIFFQQFVD